MNKTQNGQFNVNCPLFFGVFRRGNKPPVQPGVKKDFSKAKMGELKASPKRLEENQTSKYNSSGLAAALLKYKEVQF